MRRDDLDVLDGPASVAAVVLETGVRELDVSILVRQLVLLGPSGHCIGPLLRRLAPFSARSVFRLEEPLILPLQFFLENHTADWFAPLGKALACLHVRAVDPGIVGQLTGFGDTDIERLSIAARAGPSRSFEDVSPMASKAASNVPTMPTR